MARSQLFVLLALLTSFTPSLTHAADWGKWESARTLYDAGKYDDALKELQATPSEEGAYFHNVGTVLARLGQSGKALAYLEKANRLEPHDASIQKNLRLTRAAVAQTLGEDKLDPASTWMEILASRVPLEELRGTLGLMTLILILLWLRTYLRTRSLAGTFARPAGVLGALGLAITASLYVAARASENHPAAILVETQPVRSGPGKSYLELGKVSPGAQVRLLEMSVTSPEAWHQVRFDADAIGWLPESAFLILP
jgi:tetratricopeptide (TPR) repeat protein